MRALYNFVEAETGLEIGNLNGLELAIRPRAGETVVFAADGQAGEVTYIVEHIRHIVHKSMDGELAQIIDVIVRPAEARQ